MPRNRAAVFERVTEAADFARKSLASVYDPDDLILLPPRPDRPDRLMTAGKAALLVAEYLAEGVGELLHEIRVRDAAVTAAEAHQREAVTRTNQYRADLARTKAERDSLAAQLHTLRTQRHPNSPVGLLPELPETVAPPDGAVEVLVATEPPVPVAALPDPGGGLAPRPIRVPSASPLAVLGDPGSLQQLVDQARQVYDGLLIFDRTIIHARALDQHPKAGLWRGRIADALAVLADYAAARQAGEDGAHMANPKSFCTGRDAALSASMFAHGDHVLHRRAVAARTFPVRPETDPSGKAVMTAHVRIGGRRPPAIRLHFLDDSGPTGGTGKVYIGYIGPHLWTSPGASR